MNTWNHTKIIATVGPACLGKAVLLEMIKAGVSVFRLNGAHGSFKQHQDTINNIRQLSQQYKTSTAILMDLPGPKYRLGDLKKEPIELKKNQTIVLACRKTTQTDSRIPVPQAIHACLKKGDQIFLNDGLVGLKVKSVEGTDVTCVVNAGGEIRSRKGINLPGVKLNVPALTEADKKILDFAIKAKVDFIGLSFVRSARNVETVKKILKRHAPQIGVIAKIEKPEALDDIDNIIEVADAVMVARGDLGIEIPFPKLPLVERDILRRCMIAGKPSITATQMLESMVNSKRPTRAEATDVAEAVWAGSDAVMLSEETAIGINPAEAVKAMAAIAYEAESDMPPLPQRRREFESSSLQSQIIAEGAVLIAEELGAQAIVTPTRSGRTPLFVSQQRPPMPILAPISNQNMARRMSLFWGVVPILTTDAASVDKILIQAEKVARQSAYIEKGDRIVITSGAHGTKDDLMRLVEVRQI
ncbi:MAG: pyruvate kinase [Pseudomonadota bacterium]